MNLRAIRNAYIDDGLDFQNATARTCRDLILALIAASRMANHVTVKGGVVMQQITGDKRRATRDLDLDFVRYPMTDTSIRQFISALCPSDLDIRLEIYSTTSASDKTYQRLATTGSVQISTRLQQEYWHFSKTGCSCHRHNFDCSELC